MATEWFVEVFRGGGEDVVAAALGAVLLLLLGDVAESARPGDGVVVVVSLSVDVDVVVLLLTWYSDLRGKEKGSPTGLKKVLSPQQLTFPWSMQQYEFPHSPTGMQETMLQ